MPSAADRRNRAGLLASIGLSLIVAAAAHAQPADGRPAAPTEAEIATAVETLKADPNLAPVRTIRMLRWRTADREPQSRSALLEWLAGLFRWIAQSARLLMWAAVALLAAALVVYIGRLLHARHAPQPLAAFIAPTHVRDLDIRPESLPADIGSAARQLWDRGEHRAALALLYRGLLSRLAHVHRVPIRDSSTEGDALALASIHLTHHRHAYAERLVSLRQLAVYGGLPVDTPSIHALCHDFSATLDPQAEPAGPDRYASGGPA